MAGRPAFPDVARLHERHRGVTRPLSEAYAEAAAVCFHRHGPPPSAITVVATSPPTADYEITWAPPTERELAAWDNREDATRDGAYGAVLAAAECHLGVVTVARAKTKTGCDYLMGAAGSGVNPGDGQLDLEAALRLEVSGINMADSVADLLYRVRKKVEQVGKPRRGGPGMAGVVAFNLRHVVFRDA